MPYGLEFLNSMGLIFLALMGLLFIFQIIRKFQFREDDHCVACSLKFHREAIVYFANRPFHTDCFNIAVQNYRYFNVESVWEEDDEENR